MTTRARAAHDDRLRLAHGRSMFQINLDQLKGCVVYLQCSNVEAFVSRDYCFWRPKRSRVRPKRSRIRPKRSRIRPRICPRVPGPALGPVPAPQDPSQEQSKAPRLLGAPTSFARRQRAAQGSRDASRDPGTDPGTFGTDPGTFGTDPGTFGTDSGTFGADPGDVRATQRLP